MESVEDLGAFRAIHGSTRDPSREGQTGGSAARDAVRLVIAVDGRGPRQLAPIRGLLGLTRGEQSGAPPIEIVVLAGDEIQPSFPLAVRYELLEPHESALTV